MSKVLTPMEPRESQYGVHPRFVKKRMADYPYMQAVYLKELFPDSPDVIYPVKEGLEPLKKAIKKALSQVDMSMIKSGDSVNICASHHGFTLLGGQPYAELLKILRDEIHQQTKTTNIRLRAGVGLRFRETEEYIKAFGLDKHFKGMAKGVAPVDEGLPIETEIGTLYGLKSIYDADWIVHAHNSDVREVHFHRQVDRVVKPFAMSYARIDTRSTYHHNLGPRGANFTARAIFASDFVQSKFAFTAFLEMSPLGIIGIEVDNDLFKLNDRLTYSGCKNYGKIMTLLGRIDKCVVGLDFPCPVPYVFAAGVIYANFVGANIDLFDLDNPLPPYTWYTEMYYNQKGKPFLKQTPPLNQAIKGVVHNYAWGGYPSAFFAEHIPTIVVGIEQAELLRQDPQNYSYMNYALNAENLDAALKFVRGFGTENIIVFDGALGGVNVSESLAELLSKQAGAVSDEVDNLLLPKWMKQRGLEL